MDRGTKILRGTMALVFGAGVYLLFALACKYHIHFQEQNQMFLFSWEYFREVAAVPGGFADWVGRFLTQFFYYAYAGAALIALVAVAVQYLTCRAAGGRCGLLYALSFLPAAACALYMLDENALMGAPVAVLLSLSAVVLLGLVRNFRLRIVLWLVLVPVLYFLLGPLSAIFLLCGLRWAFDVHSPVCAILAVALFFALPLLLQFELQYPLQRLLTGIHYHRYHHAVPVMPWAAVVFAVGVYWCGMAKRCPSGLSHLVVFALVLAAAGLYAGKSYDGSKEEAMKYDFMVRFNMWNRIISTAQVKSPSMPMTVTSLNIALAKNGLLPDMQFDFFQNGPDGLFPKFTRDFLSPLPTAELYYHLGMINTAQRFTFEAQEAIPDFQKSARCYKRLAQTNIINGDYEVARRYLLKLQQTLFYRDWALEAEKLLWNEPAIDSHPEYGSLRKLRYHDHDFLFSDSETDSMLGLLYTENRENTMAFDCMLSWLLLSKNLPRFAECLSLKAYSKLPTAYQEALLILHLNGGGNFDNAPLYISQDVRMLLSNLLAARNQKVPESAIEARFGKTYSYYYLYRYQ